MHIIRTFKGNYKCLTLKVHSKSIDMEPISGCWNHVEVGCVVISTEKYAAFLFVMFK
jgi:hypothetical protein